MLSFKALAYYQVHHCLFWDKRSMGKVHQNRKPEDMFSAHSKEGFCAVERAQGKEPCQQQDNNNG